jgi:hypothetical protein
MSGLIQYSVGGYDRQRRAIAAFTQANDMTQWAIIDVAFCYEMQGRPIYRVNGKPYKNAVWFLMPNLIIERLYNNEPGEPGSITRPIQSFAPYMVPAGALTERFQKDLTQCPTTQKVRHLSNCN